MKQQIMGVLNLTPDSFYDGGRYSSFESAFAYARKMIEEGVDILDIGGESTRPATAFHQEHGAVMTLPEEEERQRVLPLLEVLCREFPIQKFSVDTRKAKIADEVIQLGVQYISYVTDKVYDDMAEVLGRNPQTSIILCHMRGSPKTMQEGEFHDGPMIPYLQEWFQEQISKLKTYGVKEQQIILDPGIGFGKRKPDQDFEILRGIRELKNMGFPVLIGLSRKSFMGHVLKKKASDLLPATLVLNAIALSQGADIIRVHDVADHKDLLALLTQLFI